jgi:hypothetical protein
MVRRRVASIPPIEIAGPQCGRSEEWKPDRAGKRLSRQGGRLGKIPRAYCVWEIVKWCVSCASCVLKNQ